MEEKKQITIEEKIQTLTKQIVANSKDAEWAKKMLAELTSLQKQADIEAVELIVPTKEVKQTIDYGAYSLKKTPRGILFTTKGGMSTFVEMRMQSVYEMLSQVFYLHDNPPEDEEAKSVYESFETAVAYLMQAPIFGSLNDKTLFSTATNLIRVFNEYCEENYNNAQHHEESEEDIRKNIVADNMASALEQMAKEPLPPEV